MWGNGARFVAISLLVFLEVNHLTTQRLLGVFAYFFALFLLLGWVLVPAFKLQSFSIKPRLGFLALHIVSVALGYLAQPYLPNSQSSAVALIGLRFIYAGFLFALVCTFTLAFARLSREQIKNGLKIGILSAILSPLITIVVDHWRYYFDTLAFESVQEYLWRHLGYGLGHLIYWMLKVIGLEARFFYTPQFTSVVTTDRFTIEIVRACSGFVGIYAFVLIFAGALAWVRWVGQKILWKHALLSVLGGTLLMYMVNALRIWMIVLLGHFFGIRIAADYGHSLLSQALYCVALFVMVKTLIRFSCVGQRSRN